MPWKVDYAHTSIGFSIRHMMITNVRGRFEKFTIETGLDEDKVNKIHDANILTEDDFLNSHLTVQIEVASINTNAADRDAHLRSPDFFNAEKYPYITFKAKRGEKKDDSHGKLIGDLTIRDVTKEVALDVEYLGQAQTPWGAHNAGFEATTRINRKDWGLTWNVALESGGWLVGDDVRIDIAIEFTKVAEPAQAEEQKATA